MIALRPYQETAVERVFAEFERVRSPLVVMPTGTGKTIVFAAAAERFRPRGRVLVLAHREELVRQAVDKIQKTTRLKAEIEMGAERAAGGLFASDVVVATVQSLAHARRREGFPPDAFGMIVVDEAHHATAASYRAILEYFGAAKVLGVTATPDRGDGAGLGDVFDSVAFTYEIRDAIDEGYLVPIRQKAVAVAGLDLSKVRTTAGDLNEGDLEAILNEEENLHGIAHPTVELSAARPTMVFGATVEHAHRLAEVIGRHVGDVTQARALDGTSDKDHRRRTLAAFAAGEFRFLVNCLDEQTEILTRRGWVGAEFIREGDLSATRNPATGALEWQPVKTVVMRERAAGERMVRIRNQTLDVRVTAGHRMLVRSVGAKHWKIVEAGTLPNRVGAYQLPLAVLGAPDALEFPQGTTPPSSLTEDECRFIGLWIADGHLDRSGGARGITIGQSQRYVGANKEIRRILTACGFDWKERVVKPSSTAARSKHLQNVYAVPKGSIGGQLRRSGFAHLEAYLDKDLSWLLYGLDASQVVALVEGIWLGDGVKAVHRVPRGGVRTGWTIVNTNKTLLDRLQALVVTRGLAANISKPRDNGPKATKPIYTIGIRRRDVVGTNNHTIATSGGNPATFEPGWHAERVWCVTNENGTIITRRNGKAMVMGQCALFTEGFDEPTVGCVAVARPTKSRALYAQMIGRGTRLHPGKPDLLVLDFEGNAGRHSLVSVADILGAREDDEVVARAKELAAAGGVPVHEAIDQARAAVADEKRKKVIARARFEAVEIDPFSILGAKARNTWWSDDQPTEKQLAMLGSAGIEGVKTKGQASALIDKLFVRRKAGLCSFKQAKLLAKFGLQPDVTFERARELIDAIKANRWKVPPELRRVEVAS